MILNNTKQLESELTYESYNSDEKDINTTIDSSNMYLVMEIVSNFYRNPIGSIVREITSNCFDAHKKAGNTEDAVVIKVGYDYENSNYYIEFIDKGTGLSEEQVKDIYAIWFNSDKRGSNDFIGGFGLGSKSPFSYTDIYYITTNFDGVKYEYVNFKKDIDDKGIREFKFSQLGKQETKEQNGTTIRIDLLEDNDLLKFCYEIRNQLSYFYNVYLDCSSPMYSDYKYNTKYFNEEKIIEYKTFSHRCRVQGKSYYETNSDKNVFILLGTVKYEINLNEMPDLRCNLPLGIKFEIGDLTVVPNREDIHYSEYNKNKIRAKFELFKQEIYDLLLTQNTLEFNNYFDYKKTKRLSLLIGNNDYNIRIDNVNDIDIFKNIKQVFIPLKDYNFLKISPQVLDAFYEGRNFENLINDKVIVINHSFSPIAEYFNNGIKTIYKVSKQRKRIKIVEAFQEYVGYCYKKKISNANEYYSREDLGLDNFLSKLMHDYKQYEVTLKDGTKTTVKTRVAPELGKAVKLFKMVKYFKSVIQLINSDDIIITDAMKAEYKEFLDSKNLALMRKRNKQFIIYCYQFNRNKDYGYFSKTVLNVAKLEGYRFCIYKIKEVSKENNNYVFINGKSIPIQEINNLIHYANNVINKKNEKFIYFEISNSELVKLKKEGVENLISIEDFLITDFAKKNVYKSIIKRNLKNSYDISYNLFSDKILFSLNSYYRTKFAEIRKYSNSIESFEGLHKLYNEEKLSKNYSCLLNTKLVFYYKIINEINEAYKNNPILHYLNVNTPKDLALPLVKKVKFLDYLVSPYHIKMKAELIDNRKKELYYFM